MTQTNQLFADYVSTTLAAAATNSQGTILVASTTGFPTIAGGSNAYFYLTIVDYASWLIDATPPDQREVVKVTAYSSVTGLCTVTRAITTTAQIWASGSVVELRPCRQGLADLRVPVGGTTGQALARIEL